MASHFAYHSAWELATIRWISHDYRTNCCRATKEKVHTPYKGNVEAHIKGVLDPEFVAKPSFLPPWTDYTSCMVLFGDYTDRLPSIKVHDLAGALRGPILQKVLGQGLEGV